MKKVLIVSPTCFAPDWEGNRKRVKQIIETFERIGCEVHFLYIRRQPDADSSSMESRLPGRYHELADQRAPSWKSGWLNRTRVGRWSGWYKLCNLPGDSWYFEDIGRTAQQICKQRNIDAIVCEYIFYSKLLEVVDVPLKIIDTHDVFADRYLQNLKNGQRPAPWYSTNQADEVRALRRADIVIAIQEDDAKVFRKYGVRCVITLPYVVPYSGVPRRQRQRHLKLCFLGANNDFNRSALHRCLHEIIPNLRAEAIDLKFSVIGGICDTKKDYDGISADTIFLGRVEDLGVALAEQDVLLNPLMAGTGLPIKVLDALSQGLIVLGTSAGLRGLQEIRETGAISVCDDAAQWVAATKKIAERLRQGEDISNLPRGAIDQLMRKYRAAESLIRNELLEPKVAKRAHKRIY